jgi:hypothetical protein
MASEIPPTFEEIPEETAEIPSDYQPTFAEALREYGLATVAFNANPCSETAEVLKAASVAFVAAERRRAAAR